jgi:hypothetical protein
VAHDNEYLHGKVQRKRTAKKQRRQSPYTPHGKEILHGKGSGRRRGAPFAVRTDKVHGKGTFVVRSFLCHAPTYIYLFFFLFYSYNTYIYFF